MSNKLTLEELGRYMDYEHKDYVRHLKRVEDWIKKIKNGDIELSIEQYENLRNYRDAAQHLTDCSIDLMRWVLEVLLGRKKKLKR